MKFKKILVIPDSFKGSLSSIEAAREIKKGLRKSLKKVVIDILPFSDGGDGFIQSLNFIFKRKLRRVKVTSPLLNKKVIASYLIKDNIAIIEMAQASGINLLRKEEYNPLITTTIGTGEIIRYALLKGVKKIVLSAGGSATVDCGAGMLSQLGIKFFNNNGIEIIPGGGSLNKIKKIELTDFYYKIKDIDITIAVDVTNRLLGKNNGIRIYSPQKGATKKDVKVLEKNIKYFVKLIKKYYKVDIANFKGSGAAGGIAAGLKAFFKNVRIVSGAELFLELINFKEKIKEYDLIITGEGKLDFQTLNGKAVKIIMDYAELYKKKVIIISGMLGEGYEKIYSSSVLLVEDIITFPMSLDYAMNNSKKLLQDSAYRVGIFLRNSF